MSSSFREVKAELDKQATNGQAQCRQCRATAEWKVISDHGGLCFPCFQAYTREPFVKREPSRRALELQAEIRRLRGQG